MIRLAMLIIGLLLFFGGCAPEKTPLAEAPPVSGVKVKPVKEKAAWEVEWEKTLSLAKLE